MHPASRDYAAVLIPAKMTGLTRIPPDRGLSARPAARPCPKPYRKPVTLDPPDQPMDWTGQRQAGADYSINACAIRLSPFARGDQRCPPARTVDIGRQPFPSRHRSEVSGQHRSVKLLMYSGRWCRYTLTQSHGNSVQIFYAESHFRSRI